MTATTAIARHDNRNGEVLLTEGPDVQAAPAPPDQRHLFVFQTADLTEAAPLFVHPTDRQVNVIWDPRLISYTEAVQMFQRSADALALDAAGVNFPPLTAEQRGPGWQATYGCPNWCVMDHPGEDGEPGWHHGPDAVIPPLADKNHDPDERGDRPALTEPLISARVTQTGDQPDIFGVETELWIWDGGEAYELDLAGARKMLADVKAFVPQLEAAIELLADAQKVDRAADPVAKAQWRAEQDARAAAERAALASL